MKKALLTLALLASGSVFAECPIDMEACQPAVNTTQSVAPVSNASETLQVACADVSNPACIPLVNELQVACSDLSYPLCGPIAPVRVACSNPSCDIVRNIKKA